MKVFCGFFLACMVGSAAAQEHWTAARVGTLGGWYTSAAALNDRGEVVGVSSTAQHENHAFLYSAGRLHDLGTLGGSASGATGINNAGQVVGWSFGSDGGHRAFIYGGARMQDITPAGAEHGGALAINQRGQVAGWSQTRSSDGAVQWRGFTHASSTGATTSFGTLGGAHSHVRAINGAGQVVGESNVLGDRESHAYLHDGRTMTPLGHLGGAQSGATAINEAGDVVGHASLPDAGQHAFLWRGGTLTDMGTLGGTQSRAADINDRGQAVGHASLAGDENFRAFLFDQGRMTDLGTLGGASSQALGINNLGQVVGWAEIGSPAPGEANRHVFFYSDGVMTDLTSWVMRSFDIVADVDPYSVLLNDVGQVVLSATFHTGDRGLFLLSPAPEPLTYALMLAGLAALAALRRRNLPG
jgi:probable HAF family extracellular repeat protein